MPYIFTGKYVPPYLRNNPIVPKRDGGVKKQPEEEANLIRMRVDDEFISSYEGRFGNIANHQVISEYSVTIDREVKNDRSNAKYLVEENIRDGVSFDLAEGLDSFKHRGKYLQKKIPFCKWAISQSGNTIKEVFGGADFACWRGTLRRIAMTVLNDQNLLRRSDGWTMVAQNFGGVIFLSEQRKMHDCDGETLGTYSVFKFIQYMTADEQNGCSDTNSPVDNRATFEMMVRSDLMDGENMFKLCCGTEIGALKGGSKDFEPIDFKTVWGKYSKSARKIATVGGVIQSELAGVKSIVTGFKEGDMFENEIVVNKVVEKKVDDIKSENNISKEIGEGYAFLVDILTKLKNFIEGKEACEVSYDPFERDVVFKSISGQEAKEMGHGVTDEFLTRFNIHQDSKSASDPIESSRKAMDDLNFKERRN